MFITVLGENVFLCTQSETTLLSRGDLFFIEIDHIRYLNIPKLFILKLTFMKNFGKVIFCLKGMSSEMEQGSRLGYRKRF